MVDLQVSWDIINLKALLDKNRPCQQSYFLGKCRAFLLSIYGGTVSPFQLYHTQTHTYSKLLLPRTQSKVKITENSRDK